MNESERTIPSVLDLVQNVPDNDFWQDLDEGSLTRQFRNATREDFCRITPLWDLSNEAKQQNAVIADFLARCVLFRATPREFLLRCRFPEHYRFEEIWHQSSNRRLLRIVGLWLKERPLSPPVFDVLDDGNVVKVDGHHRTTVALLSERSPFLFYAPRDANFDAGGG